MTESTAESPVKTQLHAATRRDQLAATAGAFARVFAVLNNGLFVGHLATDVAESQKLIGAMHAEYERQLAAYDASEGGENV